MLNSVIAFLFRLPSSGSDLGAHSRPFADRYTQIWGNVEKEANWRMLTILKDF